MSVFYRCVAPAVPVVFGHSSAGVSCGYSRFAMSDLSENTPVTPRMKEGRGRPGGMSVSRILSVIFFLAALGVFLGGAFFWLRKHQAAKDSSEAARICATPEMLSGKVNVALKDKVDYSFWPPHYVPPMERQDLRAVPPDGPAILELRRHGAEILFCVEFPGSAAPHGQTLCRDQAGSHAEPSRRP